MNEFINDIDSEIRKLKNQDHKLILNDSTTEAAIKLMSFQEYPSCFMCRDELYGFISNMNRVDRPNDRSFYLEGWNGTGRYVKETITRGEEIIENMAITVFGGIQPGKLSRLVEESTSTGTRADGLLQRFTLMVFLNKRPPRVPQATNMPEDLLQRIRFLYQRVLGPIENYNF